MPRPATVIVAGLALMLAVVARGQAAAPAQGILYTHDVDGAVSVWEAPTGGGDGHQLVADAEQPAWAPDGSRFAFVVQRGPDQPGVTDIATAAADGTDVRVLTRDGGDGGPTWSPDGARIAFARAGAIWTVASDGSAPAELTHPPVGSIDYAPDWSPDGRTIVFTRTTMLPPTSASALWTVDVAGGLETRITQGVDDARGAWSPDGTRIAFLSGRDRDGRSYGEDETSPNAEVYVMDADGSSPRRITHTRGPEDSVRWSASGRRLLWSSSPASASFGPVELVVARADGGCPTTLTEGVAWHLDPSGPRADDLDAQPLRCSTSGPAHAAFVRPAARLASLRVHGGRPAEAALARRLLAALGSGTAIRSLTIGRPPVGRHAPAGSAWLRFVVPGSGTRNSAAAVRPSWEPWLVADRYAALASHQHLRRLRGITIHYRGSGQTVSTDEAARRAPPGEPPNETLSAGAIAHAIRSPRSRAACGSPPSGSYARRASPCPRSCCGSTRRARADACSRSPTC